MGVNELLSLGKSVRTPRRLTSLASLLLYLRFWTSPGYKFPIHTYERRVA
jgi:hypothetical protein